MSRAILTLRSSWYSRRCLAISSFSCRSSSSSRAAPAWYPPASRANCSSSSRSCLSSASFWGRGRRWGVSKKCLQHPSSAPRQPHSAHRATQPVHLARQTLDLTSGLVHLLLGLAQGLMVTVGGVGQVSILRSSRQARLGCAPPFSVPPTPGSPRVLPCSRTFDLYHSSASCRFFAAMFSYCARMSLSAAVSSGFTVASTSICCTCWLSTLTCRSRSSYRTGRAGTVNKKAPTFA